MKFCPYCGASLVGGAVSFCTECGKALPETGAEPVKPPVCTPVKKQKKPVQAVQAPPKPNPMDEHYDGYYR